MNDLTAVQVDSEVHLRERESWLLALFNRCLGVTDTVVLGHVLAGDGGAVLAAPRPPGRLSQFDHLLYCGLTPHGQGECNARNGNGPKDFPQP